MADIVPPKMPDVILSSIRETKEREKNCEADQVSLPEHLRTLYRDSLINLKTDEEKQILAEVLRPHESAFAKSPTDLG